jgi:hypothetical protein
MGDQREGTKPPARSPGASMRSGVMPARGGSVAGVWTFQARPWIAATPTTQTGAATMKTTRNTALQKSANRWQQATLPTACRGTSQGGPTRRGETVARVRWLRPWQGTASRSHSPRPNSPCLACRRGRPAWRSVRRATIVKLTPGQRAVAPGKTPEGRKRTQHTRAAQPAAKAAKPSHAFYFPTISFSASSSVG